MSKNDLIESIQTHNRSAGRSFLERFTETQLGRYLAHLEHLSHPRHNGWVRTIETPAIMARVFGQAA